MLDSGDTQLPWSHVSPGAGREGTVFLGEQSGVGEAEVVGFADYDVVKNADAEDFGRFDQPACAFAVFTRGSGISRGVVMNEDDRSRAGQNSGFPDLPLMHDRGGKASNADRMVADGSVFGIKCDRHKMLSIKRSEFFAKAVKKLSRVLEFRISSEVILRFPHKHDPVTGKNILESLPG
jgi:hypothetical protein